MTAATPQPSLAHADLTRFQLECLYQLADGGATHGLGLKDRLESYYGERVNNGRLYPNLDALVDAGLIARSAVDGRTNEYRVTDRGRELIRRDAQRRTIVAEGLGGDE